MTQNGVVNALCWNFAYDEKEANNEKFFVRSLINLIIKSCSADFLSSFYMYMLSWWVAHDCLADCQSMAQ